MTDEQEKQLLQLVQQDDYYQTLLAECHLVETAYQDILRQLPESHAACIELYISLCEEMEHRRTCLAVEKMSR